MSVLNPKGPRIEAVLTYFHNPGGIRMDWPVPLSGLRRSLLGGSRSLLLVAALVLHSAGVTRAETDLLSIARDDRLFTADFIHTLASEPTTRINETRDDQGRTMLHWLASRSHQARLLVMLLYKADVNVKDNHGRTPLFYNLEAKDPFWSGDSDWMILEMLTLSGADLNVRADDGMTPLAVAVTRGDFRKAAFLIEHGAALAPEGVPQEKLPATLAAAGGDQHMIALFTPAKKDDAGPAKPETPEALPNKSDALLSADIPAMKKLIAAGWDVNERDEKGRTALYRAVEEKRADLAFLLLSSGADPNIANETGMTPLMASLRLLNIEGQRMMAMLLLKGANVHALTKKGTSALVTAVSSGHDLGVLALIGAGASPFEVTPKGSLMAYAEHGPTAYLLSQFGLTRIPKKPPTNPVAIMFEAARHGDVAGVEKALDSGIAPDTQYDLERTAMDWAVYSGQFAVVDLLLKRGADINHQHPSDGEHVLHMLAAWGPQGASSPRVGSEHIEKLLARGANPNIAKKDGTTPLMIAAKEGAIGPILDTLLKGGADINARNKAGLTALSVARKYGRTEMAEYLRSKGAQE